MPGRREPLRVGVLLDGWRVPAWVYRVVEEIQASPSARVTLVVLRRDPEPRPGLPARLWRRRRHLLYELYSRLDRRLLRVRPDAFERRDLRPLLPDAPVLEATPRTTRYSDRVQDADVAAIRAHDLDVLLRFGFRILRGDVLGAARHGVWSYHHGDSRLIRGGPPGFWEVMEGHPVTGSVLQVLTERLDAGRVLYRSWSPTHRRSVIRNRNHVYWKSAAFVGRSLDHLAEHGEPPKPEDEAPWRAYDGPLYRKPSNPRAAVRLAGFAARAVPGWLLDRASRKQWFLAFSISDGEQEVPESPELFRFRPILPPRDRFWADPFPLRRGDRWTVFCEEYLYGTRRGRISAFEIDPQGNATYPEPVLERPYHLSYPFVFDWRGETFMVPESAAARRVELLRCRSFPGDWETESVLLDGVRAVDATLHQEDDAWWMFVNVAPEETGHCHDELYLFFADSPLGPWCPHPRNPVVSDARCARPAGRPFRCRGNLLRPAQDCSDHYGSAVTIQRVLRLTRTDYREEPVSRIEPRWRRGLLGTHTLNRSGRLVMVDGLRRIVRGSRGAGGAA